MTAQQARVRAIAVLDEMSARSGTKLAIIDDETREEPWCWVFLYNSAAYVETGDFRYALAGDGPIVVEKDTDKVHRLSSASPIEDQLAEIRR